MAVVTGQAVVLKGSNGLGILLGSGPPDSTIGVDGQPGYLDQTNNLLYGPRLNGSWPSVGYQFGGNLLMYAGAPPNSFGAVGNLSLDITQGFIYGPKSASGWPSQPLLALVGPQGIPGPQGAPGTSPTLPNDYTANSLIIAPVSGDSSPVQILIKNGSGQTVFACDANGNVTIAGTLTVSGAATFAGFTATSAQVNGPLTSTGLASVGGVKLASGTAATFADGTQQTTAYTGAATSATASRAVISGGSYYNTSTNTTYWTTVVPKINNNNNTAIGSTEYFFKAPFAFSVTGWTLNQYVANGSNSFQICKNRTSSTMNNIVTTTAGNATVSGFPGNQFSGTYTKGLYAFAAGDVLSVVVAFSTGTSTNMDIQFAIEWT
jgi:hypothetical protein